MLEKTLNTHLIGMPTKEKLYYYKMRGYKVESEENRLGINYFGIVEDSWFNIDEKPARRLTPSQGIIATIAIALDKDQILHKRSIYSLLDWLGDVGGLLAAL